MEYFHILIPPASHYNALQLQWYIVVPVHFLRFPTLKQFYLKFLMLLPAVAEFLPFFLRKAIMFFEILILALFCICLSSRRNTCGCIYYNTIITRVQSINYCVIPWFVVLAWTYKYAISLFIIDFWTHAFSTGLCMNWNTIISNKTNYNNEIHLNFIKPLQCIQFNGIILVG